MDDFFRELAISIFVTELKKRLKLVEAKVCEKDNFDDLREEIIKITVEEVSSFLEEHTAEEEDGTPAEFEPPKDPMDDFYHYTCPSFPNCDLEPGGCNCDNNPFRWCGGRWR